MAKHYTLNTKKKKEVDRFSVKCGLFHRYISSKGTGIAVLILELLSLALTSIFSICIGIFGASFQAAQYETDFAQLDASQTFAVRIANLVIPGNYLWLISSIIFVVGTLVLVLGFSKISSLIHGAATVCLIIGYNMIMEAHELVGTEADPGSIMLPNIFIFIITVVIALLVNFPKWLDKKHERDNAVAPSILSDKED